VVVFKGSKLCFIYVFVKWYHFWNYLMTTILMVHSGALRKENLAHPNLHPLDSGFLMNYEGFGKNKNS